MSYGNLPVQAKARLLRLVNTCSKHTGNQTLSFLQEMFHSSVQKLALKISTDSTHVFHSQDELSPSGRRYRLHKCRTNRYKRFFLPSGRRYRLYKYRTNRYKRSSVPFGRRYRLHKWRTNRYKRFFVLSGRRYRLQDLQIQTFLCTFWEEVSHTQVQD